MIIPKLFEKLVDEEKILLKSYFVKKKGEKGEVILKQGCLGSQLYIIDSGRVNVMLALPGRRQSCVATVEKGAFFGEVSLLTTLPVTATVICAEKANFSVLDKNSLKAIYYSHPLIFEKIQTMIAKECFHKISIHLRKISSTVNSYIDLKQDILSSFSPIKNKRKRQIKGEEKERISSLSSSQLLHFSEQQVDLLKEYGTLWSVERGHLLKSSKNSTTFVLAGAVLLMTDQNYKLRLLGPNSWLDLRHLQEKTSPIDAVARENCLIIQLTNAAKEEIKKKNFLSWIDFRSYLHASTAQLLYDVNRLYVRLETELDFIRRKKGV